MADWIQTFIPEGFMPHGHCYLWRPDILWMQVLSDATIGVAYFAIPVLLGVFVLKRRTIIPHPEVLGLFVAFIFLCGTTHFFAIFTIWYPAYDIQAWLKTLTAIVSMMTAVVLLPRLPSLIAMPGVQRAYERVLEDLSSLKERNLQLETIHGVSIDREQRIVELKNEVNRLLEELDRENRYQVD
jgi:hypothetical protein